MRRDGLISNRIVARRFKNRRNSSIGKLRRVVYILYITCIYIETSSGHDGSGLSRLSARRERRDIRSILFGVKGGSPYKRVALVSSPGKHNAKTDKEGVDSPLLVRCSPTIGPGSTKGRGRCDASKDEGG